MQMGVIVEPPVVGVQHGAEAKIGVQLSMVRTEALERLGRTGK